MLASDGDCNASTSCEQGGINAKNYNRKEARKDRAQRRGAPGWPVGGGAGTVLPGVARGVAAREVPDRSVQRELHRCRRKSAAEGDSPSGRPIDRRGLPEPSHRERNRGAREARGTQWRKGTPQVVQHYF